MSPDDKLNSAERCIAASKQENFNLSEKDIIPLIDLTLLDSKSTPDEIMHLGNKAMRNNVAAICIFPQHLGFLPPEINIKRATVVNFPTGEEPLQHVLKEIENIATSSIVDEIDYVFPYQSFLAGHQREALAHCKEAYQLCKHHQLIFKVILETGALPSMNTVYDLSSALVNNGCDFLKTSTGKISEGATLPAVFSMLSAIMDNHSPCGVKISGGIKTQEQALSYTRLAQYMLQRKLDSTCFRIGASSLLDVLNNTKAPMKDLHVP